MIVKSYTIQISAENEAQAREIMQALCDIKDNTKAAALIKISKEIKKNPRLIDQALNFLS